MHNLSHQSQSFLRLGGSVITEQRHKGKKFKHASMQSESDLSDSRVNSSAILAAFLLFGYKNPICNMLRSGRTNCWQRSELELIPQPPRKNN